MIAIVDYKMGNVGSLMNAVNFLGCECRLTDSADDVIVADKVFLPGVGAFDVAMRNLRELGLVDGLNEAVLERRIPILGICLGMQILATTGDENRATDGLGWVGGRVQSLAATYPGMRTPHIGFNSVHVKGGRRGLFQGLEPETDFYFMHGYHLVCEDEADVSSVVEYDGKTFVSSVRKGNVFGVQFHPEKSQSNGLRVLKSFISG